MANNESSVAEPGSAGHSFKNSLLGQCGEIVFFGSGSLVSLYDLLNGKNSSALVVCDLSSWEDLCSVGGKEWLGRMLHHPKFQIINSSTSYAEFEQNVMDICELSSLDTVISIGHLRCLKFCNLITKKINKERAKICINSSRLNLKAEESSAASIIVVPTSPSLLFEEEFFSISSQGEKNCLPAHFKACIVDTALMRSKRDEIKNCAGFLQNKLNIGLPGESEAASRKIKSPTFHMDYQIRLVVQDIIDGILDRFDEKPDSIILESFAYVLAWWCSNGRSIHE